MVEQKKGEKAAHEESRKKILRKIKGQAEYGITEAIRRESSKK